MRYVVLETADSTVVKSFVSKNAVVTLTNQNHLNSDWWVTFRFSRLFADKGLAKSKPQYILHIHLNLVAIAMVTSFMDV